jgi:2,3-bisphosphoglycerate-independent phosphoglycerate mutase
MAAAPNLRLYRNANLTMPTSAAGVWAGYEDTVPPVAGNSETGHQQIANLTLAAQTPREITGAINDGSFFRNPALLDAVRAGIASGSAINFCFLLSGTRGDDGRVHSAWNHLEAFLDLVFARVKADPARVKMQAILDGRDAPPRSSIEGFNGAGRYLQRLQALLARYHAQKSLCWVAGRSIAMDRDYREANTRADYLLLTRGEGQHVRDFDGLRAAVAAAHVSGKGDTDVPPIAVLDGEGRPRTIGSGEVFINLNYRPDRQRARTAALLGAKEFLAREAALRGRGYDFDWMRPDLSLRVCTMAEYHPEFEQKYGASVAFPARPHRDNLLALWPQVVPDWKYLLVAESVKALHMGYFFRGRRPAPAAGGAEDRELIPSYAEDEGVRSDSDFIRYPQMRNPEIALHVQQALERKEHRLICCNLAAPDMIGHLVPEAGDRSPEADSRIAAAVRAYEATDAAVGQMTRAALANGYAVIITSDHGNIEDEGPAHSANDVLTTMVCPSGACLPEPRDVFQARLFDVSWTLARAICVEAALIDELARHGVDFNSSFTGKSLISGEGGG